MSTYTRIYKISSNDKLDEKFGDFKTEHSTYISPKGYISFEYQALIKESDTEYFFLSEDGEKVLHVIE